MRCSRRGILVVGCESLERRDVVLKQARELGGGAGSLDGGIDTVSKMLDRDPTAVCVWTQQDGAP